MLCKLFLTVILATTPALAQRGSGGGGGQDTGSMGGSMPQQPVPKAVLFAQSLKLNKDQKEKAQAILVSADKEIFPLRTQMDRDRVQIANLLISSGSQEDINKITNDFTTTAAQITGLESKAFAEICALLKPDQMSKAGSAFDLLASMLDPPRSAGRGGYAAGRRGKQ